MKKESTQERKLRLWKARQETAGHDVSGVTTLEQAEHFFDKKATPAAPKAPNKPEAPQKKTSQKKTSQKKIENKPEEAQ